MTLGVSLLDTEHLISRIFRLCKKEESISESKEPTSQIKSGLSSVTMSSIVENVEWASKYLYLALFNMEEINK